VGQPKTRGRPPFGPAALVHNVLALGIAKRLKLLAQRRRSGTVWRTNAARKESNPPDFARLLRTRDPGAGNQATSHDPNERSPIRH